MSKQILVNNELLSMHKLEAASACEFACATFANKSHIVSESQANALYKLACDFVACKALAAKARDCASDQALTAQAYALAIKTLRKLYTLALASTIK